VGPQCRAGQRKIQAPVPLVGGLSQDNWDFVSD
jgi:hypothetical protein